MDEARLDQFRKMAEADPDNELGHFSLGKAYLEAHRWAEAIPCFEKVIELNSRNSRAYHLLAVARHETGDKAEAISTLRMGFDIADARGDVMPRNDMAALMRQLGETPPDGKPVPAGPADSPMGGQEHVVCRRCGQTRPKMAGRPFKGPLGEEVWTNVCGACWREWILMGTKVINELRLSLADPSHADVYDQHMKEFLNVP